MKASVIVWGNANDCVLESMTVKFSVRDAANCAAIDSASLKVKFSVLVKGNCAAIDSASVSVKFSVLLCRNALA